MNDLQDNLSFDSAKVAFLCDRHYGIGGDGLLVLKNSTAADIKMLFFNPDGSPAEMCGNGIRCLAKYAFDQGICKNRKILIETGAGIRSVELVFKDAEISSARVDMGRPIWDAEKIPVRSRTAQFINEVITISEGSLRGTCVSFGNPHCVLLVEDVTTAPVKKIGAELEKHEIFPERANIEFVQVISDSELSVRVWERGAGETLACGTGACAAAVVSAKLGLVGSKVKVNLLGGSLLVYWQSDNLVILEGPVREIFTGKIKWPE